MAATRSARGLARLGLRVVLVCVGVELAARVATISVDGNPFGAERGAEIRAELTQQHREAGGHTRTKQTFVPHPYVGYVTHNDVLTPPDWIRDRDVHVNDHGIADPLPFVAHRADDRVVVGITGGSVAWWVAEDGRDVLAERLGESERFAGRELRIVRLAMGGWRAPQQLMALAYYLMLGGELDALINLDGFNEISLAIRQTRARGMATIFPGEWDTLVGGVPDVRKQAVVGRVAHLGLERRRWADAVGLDPRLGVTRLVWAVRDRALEREQEAARAELRGLRSEGLPFAARGPVEEGLDDEGVRDRLAGAWREQSLQLQGLCVANDIEYFHFLQPNQYVEGSKPMGEAERAVALNSDEDRRSVRAGYPRLQGLGRDLADAGVRFADLTDVFSDVADPLYIDSCCHVSQAGYELLADRIGRDVVAALGGTLAFLGFEPVRRELRVEQPGEHARLSLTARFADGTLRPVGAASSTVSFSTTDPDVARVTASGALVSHRRGTAEVVARREGHEAALVVTADWPGVVEIDGGSAPDGRPPRLLAPDVAPRLGDTCTLRVEGVQAGLRALLYVADEPPGKLAKGHVPDGVTLIPVRDLGPDGGSVVELPVPDDPARAGRAFYCRVLCVPEEKAFRIVASSNLLALTAE